MLSWWEKLVLLICLGVLGMTAALVWAGFVTVVGLFIGLGLKWAGAF